MYNNNSANKYYLSVILLYKTILEQLNLVVPISVA